MGAWFVLGIGGLARAQTTVQSWNPFGWIYVDSVPDLDGDGFREIVVGDIIWEPPGVAGSSYGRVYVFSGLQRTILWEVRGSRSGQHLGDDARTVGDLDGDRFPDIGVSDAGKTYFLSGRDGTQLHVLPGGYTCIEPIGDMNGDDLADVLLNGYTVMLGGSYEFPYVTGVGSPYCAPMGDVDGDQVPDYIVGLPQSGPLAQGQVLVLSGASGRVLYRIVSEENFSDYGKAVASPGDFTGDGIPDFVVGEPALTGSMNFSQEGTVYFYNGRTGELVDTMLSPNPLAGNFGGRLVPAGDVNGNGTRDLIISAFPLTLYVIDGRTRETIFTISGNVNRSIRGEIDWTGDGIPDFFVGPSQQELVSGAPIGVTVIGRGCALVGEAVPRIGCTGSAHIDADFPVHLSGVEPGDRALLLIGAPGAASFGEPIAKAPWDCGIGVASPIWMRAEVETLRPGEAAATVALSIPNDPSLVGSSFDLQWLVLGGGRGRSAKALTRVLHVEIQPATTSARALVPLRTKARPVAGEKR